MSYILDALRRAQAERERGQVPGLNAQPGLGGAAPRLRPPHASEQPLPAWAWAVSGALLTVLVLLALTQFRGGRQAPAAAAAVPATSPVPTPAPAPAPVAVAVATPAAPAPPPLVVVSAPPAPPRLPPPPPPPKPAPKPPAPIVQPPAAAPAADRVPPAAVGTAALPPVLTAELKSRWPALLLGGTVWSDTPSARFIILGGQVVREGQSTPEGVVVERITPTAAVLRWRDERATLPF